MTATVSDQPETANYRAPRNLLFLDSAGQCMRKGQKLYGRRLAVAHLGDTHFDPPLARGRVCGRVDPAPTFPNGERGAFDDSLSFGSIGAADEAISV